jgi:hypothetical protein
MASARYVPGFKVIDCQTRRVIETAQQGCQYVALSYVWGSQTPIKHALGSYPKTVEDAMEVCLILGFRYLWVDQYVRWSRLPS